VKTKERILEVALKLFNEQGTYAVSTNHIAEAAGISPGNLYYHYRNKEEIIRALYQLLDQTSDRIFTLTAPPTGLADLERLLEASYNLLWNYRFFYREIIALTQRDPELGQQYLAVRKRGFEGVKELLQYFAAVDVLRLPDSPQALQQIAELVWLISEFWLPFLETGHEPFTPERLADGIALLRKVLEPYIA
jgi:AcrR family transcriptional regulator